MTKAMIEKIQKPIYAKQALVRAQNYFDIMGLRLFLLALSAVRPHFPDSKDGKIKQKEGSYHTEIQPFEMSTNDVIELFQTYGGYSEKEVKLGQIYKDLETSCDKMMTATIHYGTSKDWEKYTIFASIKFSAEKGLRILFNNEIKQILLDFTDGEPYAQLLIRNAFKLRSAHAVNLINILLTRQGVLSKTKKDTYDYYIPLDELRFMLNVKESSYVGDMPGFRRYVLDNPLREVRKSLPYDVSYDKEKSGRNITGFTFHIRLKDQEELARLWGRKKKKLQSGENCLDGLSTDARKFIQDRLFTVGHVVPLDECVRLYKDYGYKRCHDNFEHVLRECHAKGQEVTGGLVRTAIERDYVGTALREQQARDAERRRKERERQAAAQNGPIGAALKQAQSGVSSVANILGDGYDVTQPHDYDNTFVQSIGISIDNARRYIKYGIDGLPVDLRDAFAATEQMQEEVANVIRKIDENQAKN